MSIFKLHKPRIAVAMSGGTDSTFAAYILKKQGYFIEGFTLKMIETVNENDKSCCSITAIDRARAVCEKLGIRHTVFTITDIFEKTVIDEFVEKYKNGLTPNPCISCNKHIKFGYLLDRVRGLGFDLLATGHYAEKKYDIFTGKYNIVKNKDEKKDQTYFLSTLSQDQLKYILFPLASYKKKQVVRILTENNILVKSPRESQDICFVETGNYRDFLLQKLSPTEIKKGLFLDVNGKVLGEHNGLAFYTGGQRKGLALSHSEPLYIKKINPENNTIILGTRGECLIRKFFIKNLNIICKIFKNEVLLVKIRHQAIPRKAWVRILELGRAEIEFVDFAADITAGQQAVFYRKNKLIGSGEIEKIG